MFGCLDYPRFKLMENHRHRGLYRCGQGAVSTNCPWFCEKWIKLFSAKQSVKDKKPEARKPSTSCENGTQIGGLTSETCGDFGVFGRVLGQGPPPSPVTFDPSKCHNLPDPNSSSWGGSKPSGACKCNASLANVVFHTLLSLCEEI